MTQDEEVRDAINVLYRYVRLVPELTALVADRDAVVKALSVLGAVPLEIVGRLADPNAG